MTCQLNHLLSDVDVLTVPMDDGLVYLLPLSAAAREWLDTLAEVEGTDFIEGFATRRLRLLAEMRDDGLKVVHIRRVGEEGCDPDATVASEEVV
jgi:hypothetical protein